MPKYIVRLILLFVIFIGLFLIARLLLVPDSFGEFGFYRGDALSEIGSLDIKYVGPELCGDCHDDIDTLKRAGSHKDISCETCHGPGYKHVEDPTPSNIIQKNTRKFCGKCHSKNVARSKLIKQVNIKEHNIDIHCVECHNPHKPCL